ncbi:MAG: CerR family C-terminal domain-containing protein [Desulfopila sp.]
MAQPALEKETSQSTRERLLEAALDTFGQHGYDAATTRMIAGEAGVNVAAIPYYYNGKEGLYLAVIEHIVAIISNQMAAIHLAASQLDTAKPHCREEARSLLKRFFHRLVTFLIGTPQALRVARIIFREQLFPSTAYDTLYSGCMGAMIDTLARLLMVISQTSTERTAKIRAITMLGQVLIFRIARETAVRSLAVKGYSVEEVDEIHQVIQEHIDSILTGLDHH